MAAAVVNASPLIFLAKLGRLEALQIFKPVVTTPQVMAEVDLGLEQGFREPLAVRRFIDDGSNEVRAAPLLTLPPPRLDIGELSVVSLARAIPGATAVIDDLSAIRAAKHLGLRVRSTAYVLVDNLTLDRIDLVEFRTIMGRLLEMDYHMRTPLYLHILDQADRVTRK